MLASLGIRASILSCTILSIPTNSVNVCNSYKESLTYLIAQIFECECAQLTHGHSCDAKVEPCAIVLAFHVRGSITSNPDVKVIFLVASRGLRHIATAKLATEHDVRIRNLPSGPLGERFYRLPTVDRLEWRQLLLRLLFRT